MGKNVTVLHFFFSFFLKYFIIHATKYLLVFISHIRECILYFFLTEYKEQRIYKLSPRYKKLLFTMNTRSRRIISV